MSHLRRFSCFFVVTFASLALLALAAPRPLAAQQLSPNLYSGMRWRLIGPFRGGRALAVTGVPGQPEVFYFGAVGGGVWKTTDAGRVWKPVFDAEHIASIGAIAVAPSNPSVIYVGSGEPDMRSDISYGNGMYKSTDAGATWTHIGLTDTRQIGSILVDPRDPNLVYVAALGHAYGP
ncbi:MAG: WD40/YVTN/BNR-like repeat-containing protein, partial [Candidatus Acidiferrales bacterium]